MNIRKYLLTILITMMSVHVFAQEDPAIQQRHPLSIGESLELNSTILNESRIINVYLPFGYSPDPTKTYPVIYLLDGSIDEDFLHIAGLVQFGSFPWINMIPETIVVGITNVDRKRDFTYPSSNELDQTEFPTSGKSAKFISFIETELQPLIEATYHTNKVKTVIGQSLGGLLATEILVTKPGLFTNYIIVSPSLWWDDESLLKWDFEQYTSVKSVFIGVGKEGEVMERVANELFRKLDATSASSTSLHFEFFEEQSHGDALHLAVYSAFGKIF